MCWFDILYPIIPKFIIFLGLSCIILFLLTLVHNEFWLWSHCSWVFLYLWEFSEAWVKSASFKEYFSRCLRALPIPDQLKPNFWIRALGATQIAQIPATNPWIYELVINSLGEKCIFTFLVLPIAKTQTGMCLLPLSCQRRSSTHLKHP